MTQVVKRDTNHQVIITITGHTGFANHGEDIVCSSVSTAVYMTVGLLNKFNVKYEFTEHPDIPKMEITITNRSPESDHITANLMDTLQALSEQYPKFVQIL